MTMQTEWNELKDYLDNKINNRATMLDYSAIGLMIAKNEMTRIEIKKIEKSLEQAGYFG